MGRKSKNYNIRTVNAAFLDVFLDDDANDPIVPLDVQVFRSYRRCALPHDDALRRPPLNVIHKHFDADSARALSSPFRLFLDDTLHIGAPFLQYQYRSNAPTSTFNILVV